jgi:ribosomal protein L29
MIFPMEALLRIMDNNSNYESLMAQSTKSLTQTLVTIEQDFQKLRFQLALKDLDDTSKFKKLRHLKSQILTVLTAKKHASLT